MISKYLNHKPQPTPWHREEEPLNHTEAPGRHIEQSNQLSLSLPHQDDCNTRILKLKIISEYDQEIPQSQTAENPMAT